MFFGFLPVFGGFFRAIKSGCFRVLVVLVLFLLCGLSSLLMKSRDLSLLLVGLVLVAGAYLLLSGDSSAPRGEVEPTGETREFTVYAQRWAFVPNGIEVELGDLVRIEVVGLDDGTGGGHGFLMSDFNVNEFVRKDGSVVVEFLADKTGSFSFVCSIPCGRGHGGMSGTLTIS